MTRRASSFATPKRIERVQIFGLDVNRAVRAFGQRFADGLRGALRTGAQHDHFAAVLFFQLQRLFERVGVRLIDLEAQVGFLDPLARMRRGCNGESRTGTCLIATMIFITIQVA